MSPTLRFLRKTGRCHESVLSHPSTARSTLRARSPRDQRPSRRLRAIVRRTGRLFLVHGQDRCRLSLKRIDDDIFHSHDADDDFALDNDKHLASLFDDLALGDRPHDGINNNDLEARGHDDNTHDSSGHDHSHLHKLALGPRELRLSVMNFEIWGLSGTLVTERQALHIERINER